MCTASSCLSSRAAMTSSPTTPQCLVRENCSGRAATLRFRAVPGRHKSPRNAVCARPLEALSPPRRAGFDRLLCYETSDDDPTVIRIRFRDDEFERGDYHRATGEEALSTTAVEKYEVHCSTVSQASLLAVRSSDSFLSAQDRNKKSLSMSRHTAIL